LSLCKFSFWCVFSIWCMFLFFVHVFYLVHVWCMNLCMHDLCMHVWCMYTLIYMYIHTQYTCTHTRTCTQTYKYACTHTRTHIKVQWCLSTIISTKCREKLFIPHKSSNDHEFKSSHQGLLSEHRDSKRFEQILMRATAHTKLITLQKPS